MGVPWGVWGVGGGLGYLGSGGCPGVSGEWRCPRGVWSLGGGLGCLGHRGALWCLGSGGTLGSLGGRRGGVLGVGGRASSDLGVPQALVGSGAPGPHALCPVVATRAGPEERLHSPVDFPTCGLQPCAGEGRLGHSPSLLCPCPQFSSLRPRALSAPPGHP